MFKKAADMLCYEFGFSNFQDFADSLVHVKMWMISIPLAISISGIVTWLENNLGMQSMTMVALFALLILELITGVWGASAKGQKIESRKFARFGLKVIVWFTLFFIVNALATQYQDKDGIWNTTLYTTYSWAHGTLMVYVTIEYIISVLENFGKITGKDNSPLIGALRDKLNQWFGKDEAAEFFNESTAMLSIADMKGKFIKLNDKWESVLGYSKEEMMDINYMDLVHEDDIEKTQAIIGKLLTSEEGSEHSKFNCRVKKKDGSYILLHWDTKKKKDLLYSVVTEV
jgi:PAS domain S-box-containing protein